jgi:hypothetical protein
MLPATTLERFDCLVDGIADRLGDAEAIDNITPDVIALFLVTTSWLEIATRYCAALRVLLTEKQNAAVGPLERAIWEMWINWRYLLTSDNPEKSAAKVLLTAKIDALDFLKKQPEVREGTIEQLRSGLEALMRLYPDAYTDVQKQRERRPVEWSGVPYATMEKKIAPNSALYKLLSWDAHSTIGTPRDVGVSIEDGVARITFGRHADDPVANPARIAYLAGEVLYGMFDDWRQFWKLPPLGQVVSSA